MRFLSLLLLGLCACVVFVNCSPGVVVVPYVVSAVTVMHALLFVLHMCVLHECEGDSNAGVVAVSVYMGGTHGSGVLSSACDVLEMNGV